MDSQILEILSIPPQERSASHIAKLISNLTSIPFFGSLLKEKGVEKFTDCCASLQLHSIPAEEYIFHQGDKGNFFCIILSGRVEVLVPTNGQEFTKASELGPGATFGEVSLHTSGKRAASVRCLQDTALAVLYKKAYERIMNQEESQNSKIKVLSKVQVFKSWSVKNLSKISLFFSVQKYKKGGKVFSQGDDAHFVYVIAHGEFKFTRRYPLKVKKEINLSEFLEVQKNPKSLSRLSKPTVFNKNLQVAVKQKYEIFGFEEILFGKNIRKARCECNSLDGELLAISATEFKKRVKHPDSLNFLSDRNTLLKQWNNKRVRELKDTEMYKVKKQYSFGKYSARNTPDFSPAKKKLPALKASATPIPIKDDERSFQIFATEIPDPPKRERASPLVYKPVKLQSSRSSNLIRRKIKLIFNLL